MRHPLAMACCLALHFGPLAMAQAPNEPQATAAVEQLGGRVYRRDGQVETVVMEGDRFDDRHLPLLKAFPKLRRLDLDESKVTDAGLVHLLALPELEEVSLQRTSVTQAAADKLKADHPNLHIVEWSEPYPFRPTQLVLAAALCLPLLVGVWMIRTTRRKSEHLDWNTYTRAMGLGALLVLGSLVFMVFSLLATFGVDFKIADLPGLFF